MYIIIVGAGKLGYQLSETFSLKENDVTLIDINDEALQKANSSIDLLTINSNGMNLEVMKEINIETADLLIAVTNRDETNMVIATMAKKMGCKKVIARIRNPENTSQIKHFMEHLCIDYVCNPELEVAKEVGKILLKIEAVNMEDFAKGRVSMFEYKLTSESDWINKPLWRLTLPNRSLIVAVLRNGEMTVPNGETVLSENDIVFLIGVKEELEKHSKSELHLPPSRKTKRVMILGGGRAAFYLAKILTKSGVIVKIIERDKERCKELANSLSEALIIHGDATNIDLLLEEGFTDMDGVVLFTGFDEENILLSMLAKKHKIPKIITKVSKLNYVNIIDELGIEIAINPVLLSASEITRYLNGGRILSIAMLLGGHAEVMEIIAQEGSRIIDKPLHKLDLPKGIIIGAVVKGKKVYIPNGKTTIHEGDRVVIFCLKDDLSKIEPYFYKTKRGILNELWNSSKNHR